MQKTLLPDATQGYSGSFLYGQPSICTANGKYYLSAVKSPDALIFHEQLWGYSSNGTDFTWSRLVKWVNANGSDRPSTQGIPSVAVAAVSSTYFWGFIEVFDSTSYGTGVGLIRMKRAQNARGFDVIEIWSGTAWRAVASDGTFSFAPDILWFGVSKPKIVYENGTWYLWVTGSGAHNDACRRVRNLVRDGETASNTAL